MRFSLRLSALFVSLAVISACQRPADLPQVPVAGAPDAAEHPHEAAHSHAEDGPHGGHLVVLGDDAYHTEWVHDDASGLVTVFLLAADGKSEARTAADSVIIEVSIAGSTRQHRLLPADRDDGTPPSASRFEIQDKPLVEALKAAGQGVDATVLVDIADTSYRGTIEHREHDDGHGHAH